MHDCLGQQIVEPSIVAALSGGVVDLEQRFGFGAADRLMFDRSRGQDAGAPGRVIGVQRAGKMNASLGGRPSPVITPSRTIVSASAAVLRQEISDGSRAPTRWAGIPAEAVIVFSFAFFPTPAIPCRA